MQLRDKSMKTTIENLTTASQVNKEGRTYIDDANATIVKNEGGYYVTKHDFVKEAKQFKTFRGALNYIYN
jgi:hypothetical protein